MRPVGADQDAAIAHPVHDVARLGRGGCERRAIGHQLDAEEQPRAADIADQLAAGGEAAQPGQELGADPVRVDLQRLVAQHVEHREADRA
ncbi:MAG TPA: hypothetical protein VGD80_24565 [Kofleriaceae bacterium]